MKQRGVKFPDEQWESIQRQAAKEERSAGDLIRLAVGIYLGSKLTAEDFPPDKVVNLRTGEESVVTTVPGKPLEVPKPVTWRCREAGCDWTTTAVTASPRCKEHGFSGPIPA